MYPYPKTDGLFVRGKDGILTQEHSHPVYSQIRGWHATEKLDGTNCRIVYHTDVPNMIDVRGRTDSATLHPDLRAELQKTASHAHARGWDEFWTPLDTDVVTFYGEGIGPKVQGNPYELDRHRFVCFDIKVGSTGERGWLPPDAVESLCSTLGIVHVPVLSNNVALAAATKWVRQGFQSDVDPYVKAEGVVLKARVPLYDARGRRVMLKLKHKDLSKQRGA